MILAAAAVLLTLAWDAPPVDCAGILSGPLRYRVHVFENACTFDAAGAPVTVPDGFGGRIPLCHATEYRETTATSMPILEPRLNEIIGWPGLDDGIPRGLPVVGAVDAAGNETRSDQMCP